MVGLSAYGMIIILEVLYMTNQFQQLHKSITLALAAGEKIISPPTGLMTLLKHLEDAHKLIDKMMENQKRQNT